MYVEAWWWLQVTGLAVSYTQPSSTVPQSFVHWGPMISQSVSLVLTKLRIRYKGDHKCRRAANTGLTLLSFTWPFYILRGLFYLHHGAVICKLFLVNLLHVMHGLMSTYNYLISSCAYPVWALHNELWMYKSWIRVWTLPFCVAVLKLAYCRCSVAWITLALTSLDCKG